MTAASTFPLIRVCSGKNRAALRFAERAHRGVSRKANGDVPYILHPMQVSEVLAAAGADRDLVCAGCLHDVLEDTAVTATQMREEFGDHVTRLVQAVTKPPSLNDYPFAARAGKVFDQADACGEDAVALKGADVLVNMTDVVLDAENDPESLNLVFGAKKAPLKLAHYHALSTMIADRLDGGRYHRLAEALRARRDELAGLL